MTTYKAYGNKKTTPSRMARKRLRQDAYIYNSKLTKKRKSAERRARKEA